MRATLPSMATRYDIFRSVQKIGPLRALRYLEIESSAGKQLKNQINLNLMPP